MRFIETYCFVPEGDLVGQPVRLAQFQEEFFYCVYDSPTEINRAYLSIARKNAKTGTIAFIVIVHLVGPEAVLNSRISSGAMTRDQASEVYNYAAKTVRLSPELSRLVKPKDSAKTLHGLLMNTTYRALSSDAKSNHGGSVILAILDEVGQIKGLQDDFVTAIEGSQGAYENGALLIAISTQAPTDGDMFSAWIDDAEEAQDPSIVCHLYAADVDADIMDPNAWKQANPAMGLFRSAKDVQRKAELAERIPSKENDFRLYYLNQRVERDDVFLSKSVWKACAGDVSEFEGGILHGGLDLSAVSDLTAFTVTSQVFDKVLVRCLAWIPAEGLLERERHDRVPYSVYVKKGWLLTVPGRAIDFGFVINDIMEHFGHLNFEAIAYDRWRIDQFKQEMDRQGVELPLIEFGQGFQSISPAMDRLEKLVLQKRLVHENNPVLNMAAQNAKVKKDPAGNRKLDKASSRRRIDPMVALIEAVGAMGTESEVSAYEDADLMFV